jgi:hypothetical protein
VRHVASFEDSSEVSIYIYIYIFGSSDFILQLFEICGDGNNTLQVYGDGRDEVAEINNKKRKRKKTKVLASFVS